MPEDVARRFGSESNEWTKVLGRLARGWPVATMVLTGELGISTERLVRVAETLRELGLARRLPFGDEPWFGVTKLGVRLHRDRLSSVSRGRWISERQLCRPRGTGSSIGTQTRVILAGVIASKPLFSEAKNVTACRLRIASEDSRGPHLVDVLIRGDDAKRWASSLRTNDRVVLKGELVNEVREIGGRSYDFSFVVVESIVEFEPRRTSSRVPDDGGRQADESSGSREKACPG